LELVPLKLGQIVYRQSAALRPLPTDSIVSLIYVMQNGDSAEIAVVGSEGVVGVAAFAGAKPRRAGRWCRAAGYAYSSTGMC